VIDIASLTKQTRVYLTGGEPTVMKEVYEFMRECIAENKTDFDFTLGTNCQFISDTFLELADHFTHMNFAVSLDGYGQVNDYWRWLSNWDTIVANMKLLEQHGHNVSINIVPGIYNVTNLHLLYEFLDQEFPLAGMYLQINHNPWQSAYNHPNKELVIESMQRCRETTVYRTDGKSNKTSIDSLLNHYSDPNFTYDVNALREFFVYNDKLDKARGSQLGDYIPELEECRKLV
jgi:sulfatase maturation enzyme AslB (radical SAM superfamily)